MAERRMITKKVTDDDHFISLSSSAQALYLHLSMNADDDGFCNQVSAAMFKAHASVQDLEALLQKKYVYQFENGVIVIKHWRMANALRKDRYNQTNFKEELAQLNLDENNAYTFGEGIPASDGCHLVAKRLPDGCQMVANWLPQVRLGKDSIDKNNKENIEKAQKAKAFIPPTLEEVINYFKEINATSNPNEFFDYYTSNGWTVGGRGKMKDWRAAARNWDRREFLSKRNYNRQQPQPAKEKDPSEMTPDELKAYQDKLRREIEEEKEKEKIRNGG